MTPRITFILGCTGCGKGAVGREVARRIGAEIISVDSMKVFRRMDIGTAKPGLAERAAIPHHLIDVVEPSEEFSVAQFVQQAERAAQDIAERGKPVLAVGGTALYIKSLSEGLFEGPGSDPDLRAELHTRAEQIGPAGLHRELVQIDPVAAERIHPNDLRRIVRALEVHRLTGTPISELQTQWDRERTQYDCTFIGLRRDKEDQSRRANRRVGKMVEAGLVDEVRALWSETPPMGRTARQALGYAEMIEHFEGEVSLEAAIENIRINTRAFLKAQRTWFKRFHATRWIDLNEDSTVEQVADTIESMEDAPWSRPPK